MIEYPLEVAQARAESRRRVQAAGDRLCIMLRASMRTEGYGTPEHEDRCREALREWDEARGETPASSEEGQSNG